MFMARQSRKATCVGLVLKCSCGAEAHWALAGDCSKHAKEHMEQLVCAEPTPELASTVTVMALRNITATMAAGRK